MSTENYAFNILFDYSEYFHFILIWGKVWQIKWNGHTS